MRKQFDPLGLGCVASRTFSLSLNRQTRRLHCSKHALTVRSTYTRITRDTAASLRSKCLLNMSLPMKRMFGTLTDSFLSNLNSLTLWNIKAFSKEGGKYKDLFIPKLDGVKCMKICSYRFIITEILRKLLTSM